MKKKKKRQYIPVVAALALCAWLYAPAVVHADGGSCGDQALSCGDDEKCCEHVVALFGEGGASGPPYKEGKCIPKANRCSDFWCGPRHCQSGLFGTPSVCCIHQPAESNQPDFKCAYSELNCPGNDQQLHIRNDVASTSLQN